MKININNEYVSTVLLKSFVIRINVTTINPFIFNIFYLFIVTITLIFTNFIA